MSDTTSERNQVNAKDLDPKIVWESVGKPVAHRNIGRTYAKHRVIDALERELKGSSCANPDEVIAAIKRAGGDTPPWYKARTAEAKRGAEKRA